MSELFSELIKMVGEAPQDKGKDVTELVEDTSYKDRNFCPMYSRYKNAGGEDHNIEDIKNQLDTACQEWFRREVEERVNENKRIWKQMTSAQ